MIILAATTDKIQLISSSAATLDVHVSYADMSTSTFAVSGIGRQNTAISSATTTDILAAPAASTVRNVKSINVRNHDASLACDVTIQFNQNATIFELHKVTLAAGDLLEFIEGIGWFTITGTAKLNMIKYVTADSVHATATTFADVTGLTFPVISGRNYAFHCCLTAITNATTTGARFGIAGVTMTYMIATGIQSLLASPTASATITAGSVTATDTAVCAQTTGDAVNAHHQFYGGFNPSASGTFAIRATSEVTVASGLTVKKGSWCWVRETDN